MKEEFVNALMEKYSFFYRDPEKKELYWYFKEIEYPVSFMFIEIRVKDYHLQMYYLLTGGTGEVGNQVDEIVEKYERM